MEAAGVAAVCPVSERAAFKVVRLASSGVALAGLAMLVPVLSSLAWSGRVGLVATIMDVATRIGGAFLVAGLLARFLATSGRPLFSNERAERNAVAEASSRWLHLLGASLVLLPLVMLRELAPLWSLWTEATELLRSSRFWEQTYGQLSGIVVLAVLVPLLVPLLELAAAVWFATSSLISLLLLAARSGRLPRAYLACLILQAVLVATSAYGADLAQQLSARIERGVRTSLVGEDASPEAHRVLGLIRLHDTGVGSAADTLLWILLGYALWMPVLRTFRATTVSPIVSGMRVPAAPMTSESRPASGALPPEQPAQLPPEARRRFYENAAKQLQARRPTQLSRQMTPATALVAVLIAGLFIVFVAARIVGQYSSLPRP